jgi:predicted MFS family arabinose efflux permease
VEQTSLLRDRDFRLFWGAQTVSMFGINMGRTAVPLLAATTLHVTPVQMGVLQAAQTVAYLIFGLPAGALVDRMRRRPILIVADFTRAALTVVIVGLFLFDSVTFTSLIVLVLAIGVATTFFEIAYQSYIPALVGRDQLMDGNSKLESTNSSSRMAGPALGGSLAEVSAPLTVFVQTVSHLVSAAVLLCVRKPETPPKSTEKRRMSGEIKAGLRFVLGHPLIGPVVGSATTYNFFYAVSLPLVTLLLVHEMNLSGALVGLLMAVSGAGGVLGAATAGAVSRKLGPIRATWLTYLLTVPTFVLTPFAERGWALALFAVPWFTVGFGIVVYNVGAVSIRQALCPNHLLGRMNASVRFMVWGIIPVGAIVGGGLGEWIGIRAALFVAGVGMSTGVLWLLFSPLRTMRVLPSSPGPAPAATPAEPVAPPMICPNPSAHPPQLTPPRNAEGTPVDSAASGRSPEFSRWATGDSADFDPTEWVTQELPPIQVDRHR